MKKVLFGLALAVAFASCDQNQDILTDPDVTTDLTLTTKSVVTTEAQLDDVTEEVDYEVELFTGSSSMLSAFQSVSLQSFGGGDKNQYKSRYRNEACPDLQFTHNNGTWPLGISINYGDSTYLSSGRMISGLIHVVLGGPRRMQGTNDTITFEDFTIDSISVSGTIIKTYLSDEHTVQVVYDLTFTLPDGTVITREAVSTRIWVDGYDTPFDITDDRFEITGYVNVSDSDGDSYRREITNPLVKLGTCRYIVEGTVSLSINDVVFATIDYGDGECDNLATMTTADGTEEFEIGKRVREEREDHHNQDQNQNQNQNGK